MEYIAVVGSSARRGPRPVVQQYGIGVARNTRRTHSAVFTEESQDSGQINTVVGNRCVQHTLYVVWADGKSLLGSSAQRGPRPVVQQYGTV